MFLFLISLLMKCLFSPLLLKPEELWATADWTLFAFLWEHFAQRSLLTLASYSFCPKITFNIGVRFNLAKDHHVFILNKAHFHFLNVTQLTTETLWQKCEWPKYNRMTIIKTKTKSNKYDTTRNSWNTWQRWQHWHWTKTNCFQVWNSLKVENIRPRWRREGVELLGWKLSEVSCHRKV